MKHNTALIAGASGLIGNRIAEQLIVAGNWDVIALARRPPATPNMRWIAVDLADLEDCRCKLVDLPAVTHVFYAARYDHPEGIRESVDINAAMLSNLITTLEPQAALQHVHALQGSKYYGHQLGPVEFPMHEESPRAPGVNFYFEQEDFLRARSVGKQWTYTTTRPHAFCDPAVDHPRSIGLAIAVLAAIQNELGEPLYFPGRSKGYDVRTQFTDLALLARAIIWMAQEPRCANQAFTVVNGDNPRWCELWPRLASWFGVKAGAARGIKLAQTMADKSSVWDAIVKKHGLRPTRLDELVLWAYGDYQLSPEWNVRSSMDRARALGFQDAVDSYEMLTRQFAQYRAARIIP